MAARGWVVVLPGLGLSLILQTLRDQTVTLLKKTSNQTSLTGELRFFILQNSCVEISPAVKCKRRRFEEIMKNTGVHCPLEI